jgi:phage N-6-adenine-methyltransferase
VVIERGLATFVEVGLALLEIRDSRLYRGTYSTFAAYCRERWGFSDRRARQLVDAAEIGTTVPIANEAQARALAPLRRDPEAMHKAWTEAASNGVPTAAKVRAAVSSGRTDWSTPQPLFDLLDREFSFEIDVCATVENAKCVRFFSPKDDGLEQEWRGSVWLNPPYSDTRRWLEKAWESSRAGATVVCLVPASTGTSWWWDFCRFGEVRFLRGRLRFDDSATGAPFASAVVVFGPGVRERVVWWELS